tara:strand:+ start:387 stop:665 length:279 start_codon:yes stop_codon:yes gene_type:complete
MLQDIKTEITGLSIEQLMELNSFVVGRIKHERNVKARLLKRQLFIGNLVSFEDNDGKEVTGSITKVMRKFAQVQVGRVTWRVPISHLTKVAK